jgi:hypothetical protein
MAVDFISQGIKEPRFFASFSIVLAAKIQDLILECFVAVPTMARENATITKGLGPLIDSDDRHIVWAIAKLSCAVHGADRNPGEIPVRCELNRLQDWGLTEKPRIQ